MPSRIDSPFRLVLAVARALARAALRAIAPRDRPQATAGALARAA
jgi:hypothetical protein